MKHFIILLFAMIVAFASNAQTGTGTLDETGITVTGGDGTGQIVSTVWTVQGTPPAPVTFSAPNAVKTDVTVTKSGDYTFLFTAKDNLGNVATTTWTAHVYDKQVIIIDASKSRVISIQLK